MQRKIEKLNITADHSFANRNRRNADDNRFDSKSKAIETKAN